MVIAPWLLAAANGFGSIGGVLQPGEGASFDQDTFSGFGLTTRVPMMSATSDDIALDDENVGHAHWLRSPMLGFSETSVVLIAS